MPPRRPCCKILITWILVALCAGPYLDLAAEPHTKLSDAKPAVESNLRTSEGKKYDEQLGNEFMKAHLSEVRSCKQRAGADLRSFWILMNLEKTGSVHEVLLYPDTVLGECTRDLLMKDRFSPPPRPEYWVSVYMQIGR
jgi:hypothetical protein